MIMAGSRTYEIESVTKARLVLECVAEDGPLAIKAITEKTHFDRNFVMRALKTWAIGGFVVENDRNEWLPGRSLLRLAAKAEQRAL